MSAVAEVGRLVVRLMGDSKQYLTTLENASKETKAFTQDANGYFRDMKGRFVDAQTVMRSQLASTQQKLFAFGHVLRAKGEAWKSYGDGMKSVGRGMMLGVTAPILAVGGGAIKAASDFESSFAGIRKTVNATEQEFDALATGMRKMALETPVDVNQLNAIGEAAGQLGIKKENLLSFTKVMADLSVATNLGAQEGAVALAQFANITGMAQEKFGNLGSTIVALGNSFATNEAMIVEYGQRIAGAGTIAGFTEAEIMGMGAAFASLGIEAEAGGTAIQKMLLDIHGAVSTNSKEVAGFAEAAGMTAQEFKTLWEKDASEAFTRFSEGLGKQGDDMIATLQKLGVEDSRSIKAFLSMANAGDLLRRAFDKASVSFGENSALTKEANERYKTFASQLQLVWNGIKDQAIALGQKLLPVMKEALTVIQGMTQYVSKWVDWFRELNPETQRTIILVTAMAAALGPIVFILGSVITKIGALMAMVGGALSSLKALALALVGVKATLLVIPAIIAGVLYAIYRLAKYFGWLGSNAKKAKEEMKAMGDGAAPGKSSAEFLGTQDLSGLEKRKKAIHEAMLAHHKDAETLKFLAKEYNEVNKAIADAKDMAKENAARASQGMAQAASAEATKAVEEVRSKLAKESALFGMKGGSADIASLEYDLKQKGQTMDPAQRKELQALADKLAMQEKEKKNEEELKSIRKQAASEAKQLQREQASAAAQLLEEQLTPIEKLRKEMADVYKLADVGALTEAQADKIAEGKVAAFAADQGYGEVVKSAGAGVSANSKEAMIAMRGGGDSQKKVEDGIWEQVKNTTLQLETEKEILAAMQNPKPAYQLVSM
jgi:TP901 family phage tail tape measure protein